MRTLARAIAPLVAVAALADPPGCPFDATGDGRCDLEDLYHITQNPIDLDGDGDADADDARCLELYLRCNELLDISVEPGRPAPDGLNPTLLYTETPGPGGLAQSFEADRRKSPDGPGCIGQTWTIELIALDPGLPGPVTLRTRRDGFLWAEPLGGNLHDRPPGATGAIPAITLCEGSSFELAAAIPGLEVSSADPRRALILFHGQTLALLARDKGVADAFSRNLGGGLIDALLDPSGNGKYPRGPGREALILFELDATDPQDPEFLYDDLILRLDLGCGRAPIPINLRRDASGKDASGWNTQDESCTDGRVAFNSASNITHDLFYISLVEIELAEPTRITGVSGTGAKLPATWSNFKAELNVWDSQGAVLDNKWQGNAHSNHSGVALATTSPQPYGGISSLAGMTFHRIEFYFQPFVLQPGTYWVSIINDGFGSNGFYWGHTTTDLGTDAVVGNPWPGQFRFNSEFGHVPGTCAMDIYGHPVDPEE